MQGKCNASAASDKENFGNLVKELSEAYKPLGLHLSAAVGPAPWLMKKGKNFIRNIHIEVSII